jgi:alkylation response protein AidB-like acyl-CoA dehydrogenase
VGLDLLQCTCLLCSFSHPVAVSCVRVHVCVDFNHERWGLSIQSLRFARVCFEEAFAYAHKRKTFGTAMVNHPVIRLKLAHMARLIESSQANLHLTTYQLATMSKQQANARLGGRIALLKVQVTTTAELCAREAAQIFGGLAYTRGDGQGGAVERLYREVRPYAIGGGSEEVMLDAGIRHEVKRYEARMANHSTHN